MRRGAQRNAALRRRSHQPQAPKNGSRSPSAPNSSARTTGSSGSAVEQERALEPRRRRRAGLLEAEVVLAEQHAARRADVEQDQIRTGPYAVALHRRQRQRPARAVADCLQGAQLSTRRQRARRASAAVGVVARWNRRAGGRRARGEGGGGSGRIGCVRARLRREALLDRRVLRDADLTRRAPARDQRQANRRERGERPAALARTRSPEHRPTAIPWTRGRPAAVARAASVHGRGGIVAIGS